MADSRVRGRTRRGVFAGVLVAGLAVSALLLVAVSRGALAASFAVSGTSFKISADRLEGTGFVQFGGVDGGPEGAHAVSPSAFRTVVLDNFCQSASLRSLPVVGDVTLRIASPGEGGMSATDIVLGVAEQRGDLTLLNPQIGVDAGQVSKGPPGVVGPPGGFGQQADRATIVAPRIEAWSAAASTLRLKNSLLTLHNGGGECY
ncbi:DUF6230 family protein [Saccharothrix australiensis]|uniref:Cholesterol esterase n=1 Tax=Saccharothrix australiensis TaxID=2072 RepID=A0A495VYW7_9PSEU|nr:DUF6230 family protein [Saccharothrix australiensis]RKT54516.1 hypothetical protein C8E97_3159 [Saccharothrix australiensis]